MAVCTFFGHHDCPASVKEKLRETIRDLIENCGVSMFYVGNHGTFDAIVRSTLKDLQKRFVKAIAYKFPIEQKVLTQFDECGASVETVVLLTRRAAEHLGAEPLEEL